MRFIRKNVEESFGEMKEGLIALFLLVVVGTSAFYAYESNHRTEEYYTIINTEGKNVTLQSENGETYSRYRYKLESFKKADSSKKIEFDSLDDKQLKKDSYFKITYNQKDGVTLLEEVTDIPSGIKSKLDSL